jgi:hypothetical protein
MENVNMKLPPLPPADEAGNFQDTYPVYTRYQLIALQRDTVEACAQMLLNAGFKSTGVPAYESLAEQLRNMK